MFLLQFLWCSSSVTDHAKRDDVTKAVLFDAAVYYHYKTITVLNGFFFFLMKRLKV